MVRCEHQNHQAPFERRYHVRACNPEAGAKSDTSSSIGSLIRRLDENRQGYFPEMFAIPTRL